MKKENAHLPGKEKHLLLNEEEKAGGSKIHNCLLGLSLSEEMKLVSPPKTSRKSSEKGLCKPWTLGGYDVSVWGHHGYQCVSPVGGWGWFIMWETVRVQEQKVHEKPLHLPLSFAVNLKRLFEKEKDRALSKNSWNFLSDNLQIRSGFLEAGWLQARPRAGNGYPKGRILFSF